MMKSPLNLQYAMVKCSGGPQGQPGDSGQDALSTLIETEKYEYGNSTCLTGGHRINIGYDSDSNGNLSDDEITTSESICNGLPGSNGNPGQNGLNGSSGHSALVTREVPSPAICEIGFIINFGIDDGFGSSTADNQILEEEEITESLKVCNSLNEGARITDTIPMLLVHSRMFVLRWDILHKQNNLFKL